MFTPRRVVLLSCLLASPSVFAAHLCVAPNGAHGCRASINEAIGAAAANDVIDVGPGIYAEHVVIDKPLSLLGAGHGLTTVNAMGLPNGIEVDGLNHGPLHREGCRLSGNPRHERL